MKELTQIAMDLCEELKEAERLFSAGKDEEAEETVSAVMSVIDGLERLIGPNFHTALMRATAEGVRAKRQVGLQALIQTAMDNAKG